jgi:hypothetical protein
MERRELELFERGVTALEKMVEEPSIEIQWEPGPPICPSCGTFNPSVTLPPGEAQTGNLGEMFIEVRCGACGNTVYIVIDSYSMHQGIETARAELQNRKDEYDRSNGHSTQTV